MILCRRSLCADQQLVSVPVSLMKRHLCVFAISTLSLLLGNQLWAQPANDNFANAWALTGRNVSTNGNSGQPSNATKEAGERIKALIAEMQAK